MENVHPDLKALCGNCVERIAADNEALCPLCFEMRAKALEQRIYSDLYVCRREAERALQVLDLTRYEREVLTQTIATLRSVQTRAAAERAVAAAHAQIERVNNAHLRSAGAVRIRRKLEGLPQMQPFTSDSLQHAA